MQNKLINEIEPIISQTFNHFHSIKESELVVKKSIPILFFGNIFDYQFSPLKIVTVALNPSDKEFSETRFDTDFGVLDNPHRYLKTLSDYFKLNPYSRWFNNYEKLLQHLGASYYPSDKRPNFPLNYESKITNCAIHTDICSPIATSKTWSKLLSKSEKEFKYHLQSNGELIWANLINCLKPDLILLSGAKRMQEFFDVDWQEIKLPNNFHSSHRVSKASNKQSKIYWFSAKNTPLSFKDSQLSFLAEQVLSNKNFS